MRLHRVIYRVLLVVLRLNARVYGTGASHELCRDLAGMFGPEVLTRVSDYKYYPNITCGNDGEFVLSDSKCPTCGETLEGS